MGGFILLPFPSKSFDRVESGSSFKGNCLAEVLTKKLFFENTNFASSCWYHKTHSSLDRRWDDDWWNLFVQKIALNVLEMKANDFHLQLELVCKNLCFPFPASWKPTSISPFLNWLVKMVSDRLEKNDLSPIRLKRWKKWVFLWFGAGQIWLNFSKSHQGWKI